MEKLSNMGKFSKQSKLNKLNKLRKLILALTIVNAVLALVSVFSDYLIRMLLAYKIKSEVHSSAAKAGTIGVIGGADGPTVVFISGKPTPYVAAIIFAVHAVAGIIYLVLTRKE